VKGLLEGLEAEIHFVPDVMLPAARVVDALKRVPTVSLRLHVESRGAVTHIVLERTTTIGVGGPLDAKVAGNRPYRSRQRRSAIGYGSVIGANRAAGDDASGFPVCRGDEQLSAA
jgi:hypothetical protein